MARFPTPQQIVDAFRAEGLTVVEMPGWRERCRCCSGPHDPHARTYIRAWTDFVGITWHSTYGARLGGQAAIDYTKRILIAGNGSVPGPLCLAGVDADGRMLMVSAGRANHVGRIGQAALTAMRRASFSTTGNHNLRGQGIDGNQFTMGFEALGSGAPNTKQIDAMVRGSVALCRLNNWTGQEVHGHGEVSVDRSFSDPGNDMGHARRAVMARLRATKPISPPPQSADPPAIPAPLGDSVPDIHAPDRFTVTHHGKGWMLIDLPIFPPRNRPTRYTGSAHVAHLGGADMQTRFVAWFKGGKDWLRYPTVHHAGPGVHVFPHWTHVGDVRVCLDVYSDTPGPVEILLSSLVWDA